MLPLLAGLLPLLGAGAAGFAGAKLAGSGSSGSSMPQRRTTGPGMSSTTLPSQGGFWGGSPSQVHQLPRFSPEQIKGLDQLRQMGMTGLQGNKFDFAPIEQLARRDFERKTIPTIAERFSNSGGSSAYGDQMAQAGVDLESNLAGMRQGYNINQRDFYKNLMGLGLQPQFDTKIEAAAPGFGQTAAGSLASGVGQSLPSIFKLLAQYFGG